MLRFPFAFCVPLIVLLAVTLASAAVADDGPPVMRLDASGRSPSATSIPCSAASRLPAGTIQRESSRPGITVDACGGLHLDGTSSPPSPASPEQGTTVGVRIDSMLVYATIFGYSETYTPGGAFHLIAHAERYDLDNGTSWTSGAGSLYPTSAHFDHVETSGETLRYVLTPPIDGVLYRQTDYNSGDHSAQGEIAVAGPLVLVAIAGSSDGILSGYGRITSNDATWYGEPRFNYYAAPVGSLVPFVMRYHLSTGVFTQTLFTGSFTYGGTGSVDFVHVTRPPLLSLQIKGPKRIPDQTSTAYYAVAQYEGGVLSDVTPQALWSVSPPGVATIGGGVLTIGTLAAAETLTIHAGFDDGGVHVDAQAQVVSRPDFFTTDVGAWPMYQADSRHSGFLPVTPSPARFALRWQRAFGVPLNPVSAGDGRVFCTSVTYFAGTSPLSAIDAATGATLWSVNFSSVFSVNPPSYAYGNVYVQTGNHASDTWLHAYDGATGEEVFRSPHEAQWERYLAPTIQDGKVYVNGGYYGGMYAFDAFSGAQLWFEPLPQYDQWTPGIGGAYAYAYVGDYSPGLYAARRSDGQPAFMIADPDFRWNGWSMDVAPVIGAHDDVLAIHDGRLISFDVVGRTIRWQFRDAFAGQPALAADVIYAIDAGALVALDERTGTRLWSWAPPSGSLQDAPVITATHAFVTSASQVYAVSLDSRTAIWSYPVAGHLAIGNGALYVASASGALSAFELGLAPPLVAHAGRDTTVECTAVADGGGTRVRLDGSTSEGPDLTFAWSAPGVTFDDGHSVTPLGSFPTGTTEVVLAVSRDGNVDRDTVVVTVRDTAAPTLALRFEPGLLWPPDQQLVHVHVVANAADACDPAPAVELVSVTSSEPDGGPNDPFPVDILDASYGQADFDVWLRAQRSPNGGGRSYTFEYGVRDASGHAARCTSSVVVPQSLGRARLEAGRLTIFGGSGLEVASVDPASIVVGTWHTDLSRVDAGPGADADVDRDGSMDRTWTLQPIEGATDTSAAAPLYARWRSGAVGWSALLAGQGVAAVGPAARVLRVDLASNPARGQARLDYELPADGRVRLTIYDLAGRAVATLVDRPVQAGRHAAVFRPRGPTGAGLFFYRLEWQGQLRSGRLVFLQ